MRKEFWTLFLSFALLSPAFGAPQADYKGKTVRDGAYTEGQAARGLAVYTAQCARCHGEDLLGNNAPLKESRFVDRWREAKLDLMFDAIKTTMPRGRGGSLTDAQYTDIVAYLLQENGHPAGAAELTPADLTTVQFVGKDGPKAVPNLSIVQVVGCLATTPAGIWNLTNGSEPIRTRRADEATADDLKSAETMTLGAHTFRLNLDNLLVPFEPSPHAGHKMFIKGVLNRQTAGQRLNVTAVGMLAATCAP